MSDTLSRQALWLPLLRQLTEDYPEWAVWKNARSAFAGTGDVDSFAPEHLWPSLKRDFVAWAKSEGMGPTIVCPHTPFGPHFVAPAPDSQYLVQLDIKTRGTFRGSTMIDVDSLLPLTEIDELGFRRARPGAEGVFKLCMNVTRRGGRLDAEMLAVKNVAGLLRSDPEGVEQTAELFGPARPWLIRAARAVMAGDWDRGAMLRVEAVCAARGLAEPRVAAPRLDYLLRGAKHCPVTRLIRQGDRRLPADRQAWLRMVGRSHEIIVSV